MFDNLLNHLQSFLATGIGAIVKALLLLALAVIVASVVKSLVKKLLNIKKISKLLAKIDGEGNTGSTANFIGKLAYLIVFLMFVPGIMGALNADSVAQPIMGLLNTIWSFIPNILAAVIVLLVGSAVARLIRQLLIPVFQRLKVDKLQEKAGISVPDTAKLSNTLPYVVYVLILIPVIITALQVLNIRVISDPAVNMLNIIFGHIPSIIVAALIIGLGCMTARFAGQIISRLIATTGIDAKLTELTDGKMSKFVLSKVVGVVVQAVLIIFFVAEGLSVLGLTVLSNITTTIIAYLPNVLVAVIILIVAIFAARIAEKAMKKSGLSAYTLIVKIAIFVIAAFMGLNQLGIATTIVNSAFILTLAALAVAFAVAFGIGGRNFAAKTLEKLFDKVETPAEPENTEKTDENK